MYRCGGSVIMYRCGGSGDIKEAALSVRVDTHNHILQGEVNTHTSVVGTLIPCQYSGHLQSPHTLSGERLVRAMIVVSLTVPSPEHFLRGVVEGPLNTANTPSTLPITSSFTCVHTVHTHRHYMAVWPMWPAAHSLHQHPHLQGLGHLKNGYQKSPVQACPQRKLISSS